MKVFPRRNRGERPRAVACARLGRAQEVGDWKMENGVFVNVNVKVNESLEVLDYVHVHVHMGRSRRANAVCIRREPDRSQFPNSYLLSTIFFRGTK